jgi:ferredoxin
LRFGYPGVADIGARLRTLLSVYRAAGGKDAALLFHNGTNGRALISRLARLGKGLPARVLPLEVHSVATIGIDVVLGAIAFGASQVFALLDDAGADEHGALLDQQARIAGTILNGLGFGGTHWQVLRAEEPAALQAALWSSQPAATVAEPASFHLSNRKRETLDFAIHHLVQQGPAKPEQIALPAGSPFGTLIIDASRCTLCKACIGACPSSALQDTEDAPKLRFVEHNCVQCGLCEITCPERAISLVPRLLVTPAARQPVTQNEAEPFHCVRCGTPFGTRQIIDVMTGRLSTHSMWSGTALRRIQMCADCRVKDMMQSPDETSIFDLKRRTFTLANSGVPYPVRARGDVVEQITSTGVPLGSFMGVTYDEVTFPLERDDVFVFCSDGVSEAMNSKSEEFTSPRLVEVVRQNKHLTAKEITQAVVEAVETHRAGFTRNDDMTVVAVKMLV